jgi:UTP--glucose-1-phosphate uridylyltransferase
MLPITKTIPKEMLPVGNKPVIQYIVEGLASAGITDMIMITSQGKSVLEDYFDKNYELEEILHKKGKEEFLAMINKPKELANIAFVKQKEQQGWTHAVYQAKSRVQDEYFIMSMGDNFFEPAFYQEMIALHEKTGLPVYAVQERPREEIHRYGVVKIDDGYITSMVEKPAREDAPSNLIMIGVYIFPKIFFDAFEHTQMEGNGEYSVTDFFAYMFARSKAVPYLSTYKFRDVGTRELWLEANISIVDTDMY